MKNDFTSTIQTIRFLQKILRNQAYNFYRDKSWSLKDWFNSLSIEELEEMILNLVDIGDDSIVNDLLRIYVGKIESKTDTELMDDDFYDNPLSWLKSNGFEWYSDHRNDVEENEIISADDFRRQIGEVFE